MKTLNRDNGRSWTPERDNRQARPPKDTILYGGCMKTPKRDNAASPTPERDSRTSHGDGSIALNRNNGAFSTPAGDQVSIHGTRNKKSMRFTLNGYDNTNLM